MASSRIVGSVVVIAVMAAAIAAFAIIWRPTIAPIDPPAPNSFDSALVRQGRQLAAIGNCSDCHTLRGAKDFAGGVPVPTPFGIIYSSNITPDPQTGIGRWSEAAFRRAMRSGVDREGRHLYPTFPYDHFTNVSDADDKALYTYMMTRQAVAAPARANELSFPLDQRFVVAGWKLLFLRRETYRPASAPSAGFDRGAYLVEGLAHCGACHTPRNALGAERLSAAFGGGEADNWQAYPINAQSPAPVPWTADALFAYLRHGFHPDHGVARGPMAEVVSNLSSVDEKDVRAIAIYMADVFGAPSPDRKRRADEVLAQIKSPSPVNLVPDKAEGAAIYMAACAGCHEGARQLPYGGVNLALSTAISASDPRNAANILLSGIRPVEGERSSIMPGFADSMTNAQVSALLNFLRARFSNQPAWAGVEKTVEDARKTQDAQTVSLQSSRGPHSAPAEATQRDKP